MDRRFDSPVGCKEGSRLEEAGMHTVRCWQCEVAERSELTGLFDVLLAACAVGRHISDRRCGGVVAVLSAIPQCVGETSKEVVSLLVLLGQQNRKVIFLLESGNHLFVLPRLRRETLEGVVRFEDLF